MQLSSSSPDLKYLRVATVLLITIVALLTRTALASTHDTSTIVIVGTVHNETDKFTVQRLYDIMDRVKPDLILVELDSSFFTASMSIKPEFLSISLENRTVADYQQAHGTPIRPYDIEGRNEIYQDHNYFKLQQDLSNTLKQAEEDRLIRGESAMMLEALHRFDRIGRAFGSESPEVINSNSCDVAMECKQYYAGDELVKIVASVSVLKQFAEFATFKRDFWIKRNDAMVTNILSWAKRLHARTILVLCGFEHRYYLRNSLKNLGAPGEFALREYWNY